MMLSGRVALVTGAASGIGQACAEHLESAGAWVVRADLNGTASSIEHLDVTDGGSWESLLVRTMSEKSRVDILVNAAGISLKNDTVQDCTPEIWRRTMAVNLYGPVTGMKQVLPIMRRQGSGSIVNIASVLARRGAGNAAAYSASKGGLLLATKCAALHCAKTAPAVRVNSVSPGFIDTPMLSRWAAAVPEGMEAINDLVAGIPMKRLGGAAEVAELVVFLATDEAAAITGADFLVDGGLSA